MICIGNVKAAFKDPNKRIAKGIAKGKVKCIAKYITE
jgi:hypothetical protein